MATGLIALLDDVAGIAKLAAASLDDVAGAAGKAGVKAAGVVVDDTAVTPRYVVGITPDRELPMIWKIARGSMRNKLLLLLPAALLLSALLPWAITPLLMIGGAYLCFEGAEKVFEAFGGGHHGALEDEAAEDPHALEQARVSGAIRTDLILSAEIMAIALAEVGDQPLLTQALSLAAVAVAITAAVYGVVGLIVKLDDIGLHLAKRPAPLAAIGRGLVHAMPAMLSFISVVGTAAMIWVGGGIIVHGLEQLGAGHLAHGIEHFAAGVAESISVAEAVLEWIVTAAASGLVGLVLGSILAGAYTLATRGRHAAA